MGQHKEIFSFAVCYRSPYNHIAASMKRSLTLPLFVPCFFLFFLRGSQSAVDQAGIWEFLKLLGIGS